MKILVIQESDWLLRGPHQQHHLMERLSLKGHIIRVIDYPILWKKEEKNEFVSKREVFENVSRFYQGSKITVIRPSILKLPILDKFSILITHRKEIKRQISEFKPDVIIGLGILNNYFAIKESKKNNIPFVYYLIDTLHRLVGNEVISIVAELFEKSNIKQSDYILTINKKLKNYAIEMGGNPNLIKVIPAGIDFGILNCPANASDMRIKYEISENDFILFFMGWLYTFSGVFEVAEKLEEGNYDKLKLFVVGDGDTYLPLIDLAKKYDDKKIFLTGKRPYNEIPDLLSVANVCILPAYNNKVMRDIVPIKIYEYLASGKPVLSTELPGIMEEFGNDGGIIYVKDSYDLLKHANDLMNDDIYKKYSEKAVDSVKNNDWSKITTLFENYLINIKKNH